jgi:hypothetical protein
MDASWMNARDGEPFRRKYSKSLIYNKVVALQKKPLRAKNGMRLRDLVTDVELRRRMGAEGGNWSSTGLSSGAHPGEVTLMGNLHSQPLAGLVQFMQARFSIRTFIETGTYMGDATGFAARIFPEVISIEVDPNFHRIAAERLSGTHARLIQGDSRIRLPKVVKKLAAPALFWLDGHAGAGFFGPHDDCPLLDELAAIAESPLEHFIFIDDARAFLAPPPPPFDADKWPDLGEVVTTMRRRLPYYCVEIIDVLICVPPAAKDCLRAFCNQVRPRI